ncbi:hypothetical protein DFH08DRAFT_860114 [Mycena albidolilacea]|uniref:Uncharacterized protein n=1 Tax=Mycena albidolilacea TaxID=1033008 RepID=A0AAD7ETN3_9AGAR|nr:hypothetical protein DFH08DRAFT_860114 [Mycena albidolilacea]
MNTKVTCLQKSAYLTLARHVRWPDCSSSVSSSPRCLPQPPPPHQCPRPAKTKQDNLIDLQRLLTQSSYLITVGGAFLAISEGLRVVPPISNGFSDFFRDVTAKSPHFRNPKFEYSARPLRAPRPPSCKISSVRPRLPVYRYRRHTYLSEKTPDSRAIRPSTAWTFPGGTSSVHSVTMCVGSAPCIPSAFTSGWFCASARALRNFRMLDKFLCPFDELPRLLNAPRHRIDVPDPLHRDGLDVPRHARQSLEDSLTREATLDFRYASVMGRAATTGGGSAAGVARGCG